MAEPDDMIIPLLREMRPEMRERFAESDRRFDAVDQRLVKLSASMETLRQALGADSFMGRLVTSNFEERIEILERKVRELEQPK
jgi:hypothetical protein